MSSFEGLERMNLEKMEDFSEDSEGSLSSSCSICLDLVLDRGGRSIAKLLCGHEFHLDCIGSAFNAKGAMQCPNCRKVEKGRWLYANGHRSATDFDLEAWVAEDFNDLNNPELPFGLHWCPFRGITQLASLFEDGDSQLNSYHELIGNSIYGDHSTASSSNSHLCPIMALQGFPHAMVYSAPPSSAADTVSENTTFLRHVTNLGGGQPSTDLSNSRSFAASEPQNHNWQLQHSLPFSLVGSSHDHSASQFGPRVSRSEASSHQRLGSFAYPHSLIGSGPSSRSNLVSSLGHSHTRGHSSSHIYQHSAPSSSLHSSPVPPIRRSRPRGFTLFSSLAATTAEVSGVYGFASVSGTSNRSAQEAESVGRHFDHTYGWSGREGLTPLPWIPDGESQWWGPFNPNQPPQSGGSFLQRANAAERLGQIRPENGYHRMPLPPRMPPHPRMPPSSYM